MIKLIKFQLPSCAKSEVRNAKIVMSNICNKIGSYHALVSIISLCKVL